MKTKEEINQYAKNHKGDYVSTFKRMGKEYISFRDELGKFTGWIQKTTNSIKAVKKYNSFKVKIKIKPKGKRGKKTIIYNLYNKKQQKQILYRMNKNLRSKSNYKSQQKRLGFKPTNFKNDAVPMSKNKKKIDILFDKYEFEDVEVDKYEGVSP